MKRCFTLLNLAFFRGNDLSHICLSLHLFHENLEFVENSRFRRLAWQRRVALIGLPQAKGRLADRIISLSVVVMG